MEDLQKKIQQSFKQKRKIIFKIYPLGVYCAIGKISASKTDPFALWIIYKEKFTYVAVLFVHRRDCMN